MRRALRRRYRRLLGGRIPRAGQRRKYAGWTILALPGGEFDVIDNRGRRRGVAMTWDDAREIVDDLQDGDWGHSYEPGTRDSEEMVRAATAPTVIPPPETKTMWGQIEYDKRLKEARKGRKK